MTYEELIFMNSEQIAPIELYDKDGNKWPDEAPVPTDAEVLETLRDPVAWDVFIDARPYEAVPDHGRYPLENEKQAKLKIKEYLPKTYGSFIELPGNYLISISSIKGITSDVDLLTFNTDSTRIFFDGTSAVVNMSYKEVKELLFEEVKDNESERV